MKLVKNWWLDLRQKYLVEALTEQLIESENTANYWHEECLEARKKVQSHSDYAQDCNYQAKVDLKKYASEIRSLKIGMFIAIGCVLAEAVVIIMYIGGVL